MQPQGLILNALCENNRFILPFRTGTRRFYSTGTRPPPGRDHVTAVSHTKSKIHPSASPRPAMSFSFNFALDNSVCATSIAPSSSSSSSSPVGPQRECERIVYSPRAPPPVFSAVQVEGLTFETVQTTNAAFMARTGAIRSCLTTSDVQTGVYEGGFKLWEGALDLVKLLATQQRQGASMPASVLELGCGHGLPGIYALQQGAGLVTFSDYNKEVLELTTCPNVRRNVGEQTFSRAEFYAGAWRGMSRYMETVELKTPDQTQFDLILTAETIYTEAVAVELYQVRRSRGDVVFVWLVQFYAD